MSHRRSINFSSPLNSSTPGPSLPSCPVFSPLIRQSVGRANRSRAAAAILNESTIRTEEDDEAERRLVFHSRNENNAQETGESADNIVASFHKCMQLFADNKITKNNAWDLTLIQTMHKLVTSNHKCMDDLQVATSTLDACTKIYGLRVDLLHAEGVQLASDLRRNQGSKKIQHIQADDDNDNPPEEVAEPAAGTQTKKKKRKRKSNGFIVQNLDLINGIPDCVEPLDRLFTNRAATRGDCEKSGDLFQATLHMDSTKMMHMRSEQHVSFKNCDLRSGGPQPNPAMLPLVNVALALLQNAVIGHSVNPSLKDFSFLMCLPDDRDTSLFSQLNSSQIDLAFDINAEVQQAPPDLNKSEPFMAFDTENYCAGMEPDHDHDEDELNRLAQNAVGTVNPRDLLFSLRNTKLEYSYRHTAEKMIMGLWAGPSHWKIKPVRIAGATIQSKDTNVQESHNKIRHRAAAALELVDVDKAVNMADFQNLTNKNTKLKPATIAGWDASKNTLPEDLHVEQNMMRSLVQKNVIYKMKCARDDQREPVCVDDSISPYNYDNDNDNEYCSNIVDERNLYSDDDNVDQVPPSGDAALPENDVLAMVDAPFRVDKVNINYATQAKIIDMKKMKKCAWSILQEKLVENVSAVHLASGLGFDELYHLLGAKLDRVQSANLTISLALSALLHLANEHGLDLIQESSDTCDEIPEIYIKMPAAVL